MKEIISARIQKDPLGSWSEIIGRLANVNEDSVIISSTREYVLPVGRHELDRYFKKMKRGSLIGVVRMPDGSVRVRCIRARTES